MLTKAGSAAAAHAVPAAGEGAAAAGAAAAAARQADTLDWAYFVSECPGKEAVDGIGRWHACWWPVASFIRCIECSNHSALRLPCWTSHAFWGMFARVFMPTLTACLPNPAATDEEPAVLVRSGAFEVCLRSRLLRPCYWPAARHRVLRGTWFAEKGGEWVPLKVRAASCPPAAAMLLLQCWMLRWDRSLGRDGTPSGQCLLANLHACLVGSRTRSPGPGHFHNPTQESLADQLEEGYQQAIWLPARGRLQAQPGGGEAARLDLSSHVDKGLYALFASGGLSHMSCRELTGEGS